MKVLLLTFVIVAALSVITSGIWVAIALIRAISGPRVSDRTQRQSNHSPAREQ